MAESEAARLAREAHARCQEAIACAGIQGTEEEAHAAIDAAIKAARREALEEACRDVCMYCGRRASGYQDATGPNAAGNWVHKRIGVPDTRVLCAASPIWARIRALARGEAEEVKDGV